jgi:hypothetical protein
MLLTIIVFAVVTLGVKFGLGVWIIYMLLAAEPECPGCGAETVALTARRGWKLLGRVTRLQRRWCLGCGSTMMARRPRSVAARPGVVEPEKAGRSS